jgi:hypothetical protein
VFLDVCTAGPNETPPPPSCWLWFASGRCFGVRPWQKAGAVSQHDWSEPHDNQRLVLECLTTNLARYDSICRLNKGSCMRQHLHRMDQSIGPACSSILLVCCMHLPELKRRPSMPGIRKPESMHPAGRKLTWFPRLAITMCHTLDDENAHKID